MAFLQKFSNILLLFNWPQKQELMHNDYVIVALWFLNFANSLE